MPTGSATVTMKTGPAQQVTAQVLPGITSIVIDIARQTVELRQGDQVSGPSKQFDLNGVTTLTDTISGGNHTLVFS